MAVKEQLAYCFLAIGKLERNSGCCSQLDGCQGSHAIYYRQLLVSWPGLKCLDIYGHDLCMVPQPLSAGASLRAIFTTP